MHKKIMAELKNFARFAWKSAWISLIFVFGVWIYVMAKNAGATEAIQFQQNIGMNVSGTAFVLLMLYWWKMDSTEDLHRDLAELKRQNQSLEDKLTATNTLLQQLVDKANQPAPNTLPNPANLAGNPDDITKLASPDQAVMASNGHDSNGS